MGREPIVSGELDIVSGRARKRYKYTCACYGESCRKAAHSDMVCSFDRIKLAYRAMIRSQVTL